MAQAGPTSVNSWFLVDLHRTLSFRYLTQRWTRTLLIVLSIALGVATLVATRILSQNLVTAAEGAVAPFMGASDIIVVNGQTGMSVKLADEMKRADVPGVKAIHPVVSGRVTIPELDNRSLLLLGIDWLDEGGKNEVDDKWGIKVELQLSKAEITGMFLLGPRPILVGGDLARDLAETPGGKKNGSFNVEMAEKKTSVRRAGTIEIAKDSPASALGSNFLVMHLSHASDILNPEWPEYVSQINVDIDKSGDGKQVASRMQDVKKRLQAIAGKRAEVRTVEENNDSISDITAGIQLGFLLGGAGALVVGLFLVYNVLSVTVAERRRDIGILRSVGASRLQISGLIVGESSLLGLTGSVLGIPLGYILAQIAVGPVRKLLSGIVAPIEESTITVPVSVAAIAVGAGLATTLVAALLPARQASREEPADAVRRVPQRASFRMRLIQIGAVLFLLGGCVACVLLRERLPIRMGAFGGSILIVVAAMIATPLLTGILGRVFQPFFRNFLGIEGRLAADNMVCSPGRVGLVIGALAVTGGLFVQTAGFIHSSEHAVLEWIDKKVSADLLMTGGSALENSGMQVPMDEKVGEQLKAAFPDDIEAVLAARLHGLNFRNRIILLVAMDTNVFESGDSRNLARNLARYPQLRERRRPQPVLVSENFGALYRLNRGDRFTVPGRDEDVEMEIVDTVEDYLWPRGTVMMDRAVFCETFGDRKVDIYDIFLKPGANTEATRTRVEEWGKKRVLFVGSQAKLRDDISSGLHSLYGLAYAQQCVVGLVALLGVIISLFISVLQRTREFGLLRAVGASRAQILRSVLAEAALMGLIGAVIGLVLGFTLEWYLIKILLLDESGFLFPLRFPWLAAGVVAGVSVSMATLVGLWPAWHATRLRIPEAIAYE